MLKLDEGSNTASGLGIEILDANMRPVKLNDLHAGMQWIPLVPEQNNILPYSARLKSTQKSVNPGLVRASAALLPVSSNQGSDVKDFTGFHIGVCVVHSSSPGRRCYQHWPGRSLKPALLQTKLTLISGSFARVNNLVLPHLAASIFAQ
ncbi:type 1 fimbrial protein [Escherichia coli]|nr:type 1 fimbrial protein [Escherichia coli]